MIMHAVGCMPNPGRGLWIVVTRTRNSNALHVSTSLHGLPVHQVP